MVYFDLKVVNIESYGGCKYLLVIVDDWSRWKVSIPLKNKGDIEAAFKSGYHSFVRVLGPPREM